MHGTQHDDQYLLNSLTDENNVHLFLLTHLVTNPTLSYHYDWHILCVRDLLGVGRIEAVRPQLGHCYASVRPQLGLCYASVRPQLGLS